MIILGLDPSMVQGAGLVAMDSRIHKILFFETWSAACLADGYFVVASIAKKAAIQASRLDPSMTIRLAVEKPFFKQWVGRFDSVKAAETIAKKGSVAIRGKGGLTSEYLNRCIGIFAAHFPVVVDYPPGEWRSQLAIEQGKGENVKLNSVMRAIELLEATNKDNPVASLLLAAIIKGNEHLGEATCIAFADANIFGFVSRKPRFVGGKHGRKKKTIS